MILSLSILILNVFLASGKEVDDTVTAPVPRTAEDQRIDDECAPRLKLGVDQYAKCVSDKGIAAESRRMMEINDALPADAPKPQVVCNPQGAIETCKNASAATMRIVYDSKYSEDSKKKSLQFCRASCNPTSSQTLRNYLSGCPGDITSTKRELEKHLNSCGAAVAEAEAIGSTIDSIAKVSKDVTDIATSDMSMKDMFKASALRMFGYSADPITSQAFGGAINMEGTQLGSGVRYMQISVGGIETYRYCAADNTCHSTFEAAAEVSAPLIARNPAPGFKKTEVTTFSATSFKPFGAASGAFSEERGALNGDRSGANGGVATDVTEETRLRYSDTGVVDIDNVSPDQLAMGTPVTGEPTPAPTRTPTPTAGTPTSSPQPLADGNGSGSGDQQVVTPVNNEPINYQAANFAGLQSAMKSPINAGGSMGSSGGGYSSEVSRGGGGGYSGSGGDIKPLAFSGSGQVSPSLMRGNDSPELRAAAPAGGGMDIAAMPSGTGSSGGFPPGFNGGGYGGRMVAANHPSGSGADTAIQMRSDSYYNTGARSGGGYALRSGTRPTAACKGPKCPRSQRKGIAGANCDGNPQCLLALTGKLRRPGQAESEVFWDNGAGNQGGMGQQGQRGLASVRKQTVPGGVVRGKALDVLNFLGSSGVFKLDHDGMLDLDL